MQTLNEICRSVMEGVTYSLQDTIEILREYNININEARASGGGAKSPLWCQIQADIFNASVLTVNLSERPAGGAAILAAVGSGAFNNLSEACNNIIKITSYTEPIKENVKCFQDFYYTYRSLYRLLKKQYETLTCLMIYLA
ncbi:MAG: hypothetical protein JW997_07505 [Actinobacteria bacterium]|nr:hypothetical protein [Actinomycetota bacterium]